MENETEENSKSLSDMMYDMFIPAGNLFIT